MNYYIEEAKIIKKKLKLEGWSINPNTNILVYYNNKLHDTLSLNQNREDISIHFNVSDIMLGFSYELLLPKFCSKIKIVLKNDNNILDTIQINNSLISNFFGKVKKMFSLFIKALKVLKKHPGILFSKKLLKKYIKVFFDKYNGINIDNTLNTFDQNI